MMARKLDQDEVLLVELTDGQQCKPVKVRRSSTIKALLKEGKNKYRRNFKYVIYRPLPNGSGDQLVATNYDLLRVLEQEAPKDRLCFLLCNKIPEGCGHDVLTISQRSAAISFVIGNESETEDNALVQLRHASELRGCVFAIGMPDLHAGKGIPIGAVVLTDESVAYPQLVDNDIGCGMSFVETSLPTGKLSINKLRKLADNIQSIDCPYDTVQAMKELCAQPTRWATWQVEPLTAIGDHHYQNLGTVGNGNHFAELQEFDDILDAEAIEHFGIDTSKVHLLVHSGSRSLGSEYLRNFCENSSKDASAPKHGQYGVDTTCSLFQEYLRDHGIALNFAIRNRQLIAKRLLEQITGDSDPVCKIDIHHNFMERIEFNDLDVLGEMAKGQGMFPKDIPAPTEQRAGEKTIGWIHRKGATPTTQSPLLVVPGSRGSLSYLVKVNRQAHHGSGYSLAHGAGRRMNRSKALALHQSRYPNAQQLLQTNLGGVVICEKKELIYEEAPASYKDIDGVVECLASNVCNENGGLVRILATLRPLLTYKYKDPYQRR